MLCQTYFDIEYIASKLMIWKDQSLPVFVKKVQFILPEWGYEKLFIWTWPDKISCFNCVSQSIYTWLGSPTEGAKQRDKVIIHSLILDFEKISQNDSTKESIEM